MNIALFEVDKYERGYFERALKGHNLSFYEHHLSVSDVKHLYQAEAIVVFLYSHITKEILQNLPCLKLIVTMSTGYDHVDLRTCRETGVIVTNVPKYGGVCVAEHTLGLILGLSRKIHEAATRTYHDDFSIEGLRGFNLEGKTLGVVGMGTIGSHVAHIARAFGMRVLANTESKKKGTSEGMSFVSLKELLGKSDIVTLHVPLTDKTYHLIDKKAIGEMRKGAFLINTARGELVDTYAVAEALDSGKLGGFAADVLEGECDLKEAHQPFKRGHHESCDWRTLRKTHSLLKMHNVIITPHIAFYTKESIDTILRTTVDNIRAFAKGKIMNAV